MKKLYYLVILLALLMIFQPLSTYIVNEHHKDFYNPTAYDKRDTYRIIRVPFIQDEKKEEVYTALQELAQEWKLTVTLHSFDYEETLDREFNDDAIFMVYATGVPSRLEKLPFAQPRSLEDFHKKGQIYSSSLDEPEALKLRAPKKHFNFYLSNFSTYKGSLQNGTFSIMDSTKEKIDEFIEELGKRTGVDFSREDLHRYPTKLSPKFLGLDFEEIKVLYRGGRTLAISLVGLAMLLYYLQGKKRWSVQRLFGYSLVELFMSLLVAMILPSLVLSILTFLPLALLSGLRPEYYTSLAAAYFPLVALFLLYQMVVVLVMILDQASSSPLKTLHEKKNPKILLGFGFAFKILTFVLIFPVLSVNLLSMGNAVNYYKDKMDSKKLYADVWVLSSEKTDAQLTQVDAEGKPLKNGAFNGEQLPWLKAFYDEIRDDYPVFWVLVRGSDDAKSVEWDLLQVNGNFVRLMGLKDEEGNLLLPNNEDKYLYATRDRAEELMKFARSRGARIELLSESTKALDKERLLPESEIVIPEVTVLEEGSKVLSFQHPISHEDHFPFGEIERFSLAVNAKSAPFMLENLCFYGITEEQRDSLLKKVSHLPYTDKLVWKTYIENKEMLYDSVKEEHQETIYSFATTIISMIVLAAFIFFVAYDALSKRWSVLYLFGTRYFASSLIFLVLLLSIDGLAYLIGGRFVPTFHGAEYKQRVLLILGVVDLILFGIMQLVYRKKTLKNLAMR